MVNFTISPYSTSAIIPRNIAKFFEFFNGFWSVNIISKFVSDMDLLVF